MDWLTLEVLPMIRRTGMYLPDEHPLHMLVDHLEKPVFSSLLPKTTPMRRSPSTG